MTAPVFDDAVNGRVADFGFVAVSAADVRSVVGVLERDLGVDLSHRLYCAVAFVDP